MKKNSAIGFSLMLLLGGTGFADNGTPMSQEELLARRAKARTELQERAKEENEPVATKHPSKISILDRSILLGNGSHWSFVPKGAVLHVPESMKKFIHEEKTGKYIEFREFARKNKSWLQTYEVTLQQARGDDEIKPDARRAFENSGRIVVSVLKGGPISVRVPKKED